MVHHFQRHLECVSGEGIFCSSEYGSKVYAWLWDECLQVVIANVTRTNRTHCHYRHISCTQSGQMSKFISVLPPLQLFAGFFLCCFVLRSGFRTGRRLSVAVPFYFFVLMTATVSTADDYGNKITNFIRKKKISRAS